MHIFASFIKQSHPSPYHWTTHGMFSIHVTKLTMNFSRFHVLHIQETDYRPHFTCGGSLYFLKHYKHTARCVNTVQMSANCVRALTKNPETRHACAPSWSQCCSGNIRKRNLFSGYPSSNRWIRRGGPTEWTPTSPDLTLLYFLLLGTKDSVYAPRWRRDYVTSRAKLRCRAVSAWIWVEVVGATVMITLHFTSGQLLLVERLTGLWAALGV